MAISDHLDLADLATRYARDRADSMFSSATSDEWNREYEEGRREFFAALRNVLTQKIDSRFESFFDPKGLIDHILASPNDDTSAEALSSVSETFVLGKGGSPHMDGTMVYPIRRKGKVGILANPRLSNQEVENLTSAGMERDER